MRDDYYNDRDMGYRYDQYFEELVSYLCAIDDKLERIAEALATENAVKKKSRHGKVG